MEGERRDSVPTERHAIAVPASAHRGRDLNKEFGKTDLFGVKTTFLHEPV